MMKITSKHESIIRKKPEIKKFAKGMTYYKNISKKNKNLFCELIKIALSRKYLTAN